MKYRSFLDDQEGRTISRKVSGPLVFPFLARNSIEGDFDSKFLEKKEKKIRRRRSNRRKQGGIGDRTWQVFPRFAVRPEDLTRQVTKFIPFPKERSLAPRSRD